MILKLWQIPDSLTFFLLHLNFSFCKCLLFHIGFYSYSYLVICTFSSAILNYSHRFKDKQKAYINL